MKLPALGIALMLGLGCSRGASPPSPSPSPPAAAAAPQTKTVQVGARAPDGALADATGTKLALADVLRQHRQNVVVFYRGFY